MDLNWRSAILLLGAVHGITVAAMLLTRRRNREANRCLSALLIVFTLALIPSLIGFAGAYGRWPWLTLAPFDLSWSFGPLLFLYVSRLLRGRFPRRWGLHLVPGLVQLIYYSVVFAQPLEWKYTYQSEFHQPTIVPMETAAALLSALAYWAMAVRLFRRYRAWVPQQVSDSDNYTLHWIRNFLLGLVVGFLSWAAFEAINQWVSPLSYGEMFWLYVLVAVLIYGFGWAGFHYAEMDYPALADSRTPVEVDESTTIRPSQNWTELVDGFGSRMVREEWYLDPDLTLDAMARRLGTNTWTLSRAINEGTGKNFNDFVNEYRVQRVKDRLVDPVETRSILDIAHECGFNSKTSFNRSFKKLTGQTPTAFRKAAAPSTKS